ncbi:hypothetical protein ACFYZE_18025 [Streptomyces sp. NPDC001796]|uniref:hypothetical protein n=1 Tax=Streptomyces sp. NPDC001796 TaxID=3364609 RepID=UPI0036C638F4
MSPTTQDPAQTDPCEDVSRPVRPALAGRDGRDALLERRRRHTLELLAVSALGLIPWTVILGVTLPSDYRVHAWRTTWVGFDILLLTALGATAVLGMRRHRAVVLPALATAVLLVCDAWFDVSLALGTSAVWLSAGLALFVELPMAAFLFHRVRLLLRSQWTPQPPAITAPDTVETDRRVR